MSGTGPAVGLGCAALGNLYDAVAESDADATVAAAWTRGIRMFDTAPLYGHGLSEQRLGRSLAKLPRDEITISTKVGRVLVPDQDAGADTIFADVPPVRPEFDFSAAGVEAGNRARLQGGKVMGGSMGAPAQAGIEEAADGSERGGHDLIPHRTVDVVEHGHVRAAAPDR